MQLQVRDVAALFEVPESTVFRWIREGEIPVHDVNSEYFFSRAELLEWATARRMRVPLALVAGPEAPLLAEALVAGGVHRNVPASDLRAALEFVVARLPLLEQADRRALLEILLAREAAGLTAVGDGIAIPHARSPLVLAAGGAAAVACHLATPLALPTPDGRPIRTLFTLVTPTPRAHVQLLARLACALRTAEFRGAVERAAGADELVRLARQVDRAATAAGRASPS